MIKISKNNFKISMPSKSVYFVGSNILENLSALLLENITFQKVIFLTDKTVFNLFGKKAINQLQKIDKNLLIVIIPLKEMGKNLDILPLILKKILRHKISRETILVAMGGGSVTDCAGFISSILLRGIRCVFIPTTLLAMVDAAIGGKNGLNIKINGQLIKNMVGTFYQPDMVISDTETLKTLPYQEVKNGFGEILKYRIAFGRPDTDRQSLSDLVRECQQIKLSLVEKDPIDKLGIREKLNLGHTVGHAVESASESRLSHGEAVSIGLAACSSISQRLGLLQNGTKDQIISWIKFAGLPIKAVGLKPSDILKVLPYDKKAGRFVLVEDIGKTVIKNNVPRSIINKAIEEITS